ncbi:MAG: pyridoxamine 5'-phosphate oxidase family protein [Candidatus Methanomethylophilaceae archaeon]|nr:pyridoxamine 5'-phosphate oxidase family protein [Candidatus Methanomethylophilaceae archaeon]MBR4698004.1 pyridoxamine 5'-phosphate oxidase family protein [Candidatus Methanomethylophilaceae archaeon]
MANLSPEIIAEMKKQGVFALATATKDGIPNVVPVGMLFVGDDGKVWLVDNFLKKTLKNIQENPRVSFYVWNPEAKESFQVKGTATVCNSGADYEKAVAIAHAKRETLPAKNLIKIDVTEVYYTTPGPHAGDLVS